MGFFLVHLGCLSVNSVYCLFSVCFLSHPSQYHTFSLIPPYPDVGFQCGCLL
ncbi:hypothetical protein BDQ17DRAFT_1379873 [Cyathus striatus]|nr:hypothetical protein BDQ17DRAFT_1379873 [Cyathus striatus]